MIILLALLVTTAYGFSPTETPQPAAIENHEQLTDTARIIGNHFSGSAVYSSFIGTGSSHIHRANIGQGSPIPDYQ